MTSTRRRRGGQRLIGSYPVASLHLVGADLPPDPRAPSQWRPGPAPLQHGVDYTFARWHGLVPVRWPPGSTICVRLASEAGLRIAARESVDAVDAVVTELRELTGLELRSGPPLGRPIDLHRITEQEIHVAYLPSTWARRTRQLAGDLPAGGAAPAGDGAWYRRGWAIVDTDLAAEPALSTTGLAVLRHQLGHALGLGHAARSRVLMHQRIPVDLVRYSRADQYGLALLGGTRPASHDPQPPAAQERTVPCC
jgi:hypothetical protein